MADFNFTSVVDAQADLGVSPGDDIAPVIESLEDGTLMEIPGNNEYSYSEVNATGRQTVGVRGVNGTPILNQIDNYGKQAFHLKGDEILLENFVLRRSSGLGGLDLDMQGSWVARDIFKDGTHSARGAAFRVASRGGGQGLMERCRAPEVDDYNTGTRNAQGIFVNSNHSGDVEIRDCEIGYAGDNGLYGSLPDDGTIRVIRGIFYNNGVSSIRLGQDGSGARGVVIVNDERSPSKDGSGTSNQRGFWMRSNGSDMFIENCDVTNTGEGEGAPLLVTEGAGVHMTNSRIRHDIDGKPAVIENTSGPGLTGSGNHLTGTNTNMRGHDGSVFECIGTGCDEPRTTPRASSGGGSDGGSGGDGGGDPTPTTSAARLAMAVGLGAALAYGISSMQDKT